PYTGSFTVASTTNSSATPVYTSAGVCSNLGPAYTMTSGTGSCASTVTWAADANFYGATLNQSTTATKISPTVTFTGAPGSAGYRSTFTVASTTNSSASPVYTASGVCSSLGTTYTMDGGPSGRPAGPAPRGPSTYPIACAGQTSSSDAIRYSGGRLTVGPEDARAYCTGAPFASTSGATSSTAMVTLAATIKDITAVPGDPAYDANGGEIRNAIVTFVNRDMANAPLCTASVGLVSLSDTQTGTATCHWSGNIGGQ